MHINTTPPNPTPSLSLTNTARKIPLTLMEICMQLTSVTHRCRGNTSHQGRPIYSRALGFFFSRISRYLFTERLPPGDGHQSSNTPAFDLISSLITDKLLALGENVLVTGISSTSSSIHFCGLESHLKHKQVSIAHVMATCTNNSGALSLGSATKRL